MSGDDAVAAYGGTVTVQPSPRRTRRRRLLEAALDVFAEEGYSGATISEIERRVGLTPGTGSLYRHFPSKEALLKEAVAYEVARYRAELEEARVALLEIDDPFERQVERFRQALNEIQRYERLFRLMLNDGHRVPELAQAIWSAVRRPIERDPDDEESVLEAIALTSLGGYHLFSLMQGRPYNGISQDRLVRALAEMTTSRRRRGESAAS
jgi:AcrR family transcriptional regulator